MIYDEIQGELALNLSASQTDIITDDVYLL